MLTTLESDRTQLGPVEPEHGIRSAMGPFHRVPVKVRYPQVVVQALADLYQEYLAALTVPAGATEHETDFRHCKPPAFAVQIDMAGLTPSMLDQLSGKPMHEVREFLRGRIFEIDSSIAMYPLLERLFANEAGDSAFKRGWRAVLDDVRQRYGKPVALLALTQEKYDAILATEFGLSAGDRPHPGAVTDLTGFDMFFGPEEFRYLVMRSGGDSPYLLFVRASDPVGKLRRPDVQVEHPLLGDPDMRRVIRANAVTLNVDDPAAPRELHVNDTKAYMGPMGLGYVIDSWDDLGNFEFDCFLRERGISPHEVRQDQVMLRAKPLVASYGGYGHVRGVTTDKRFRTEVKSGLKKRGAYVIQPEIPAVMVSDPETGVEAGYIDRLFIGWADGGPRPIGGFRNYMPVGSGELEAGRIHGNGQAFWGEILLG